MFLRCLRLMHILWLAAFVLQCECSKFVDASVAYDTSTIPDAEQLQIARSLQQDNDVQPHGKETVKKGGDKMFDEGSATELTRQDDLLALPAGNTDDALGLINQRLASEEKFNQRLQQLLTKSTLETRSRQEQVTSLQQQLEATMQTQKKLRSSFVANIAKEQAELLKERSHEETLGNQLRDAGHMVGVEHNTINLLHQRMDTVLSHLRNVTQLGKTMEKELAEEKSKEIIKEHQLAALQHETSLEQRVPLQWSAKLHEAQAARASEEAHLQAAEHANLMLRKHVSSLRQRDKILRNENVALRKQLRGRAREEEQTVAELEKAKAALAEAQKSNFQLQDKYADSLKSLLIARGDGPPEEASLSSDLSLASTPSDDESTRPIKDSSALLMQLRHDSRRLKSVMRGKPKGKVLPSYASEVQPKTSLDSLQRSASELELTHDSQGLSALLSRMSKDAH